MSTDLVKLQSAILFLTAAAVCPVGVGKTTEASLHSSYPPSERPVKKTEAIKMKRRKYRYKKANYRRHAVLQPRPGF